MTIKVEITGPKIERPANQVTLIVDGVDISGWEDIEVTLRADGFPNEFAVTASVKEPTKGGAQDVIAQAGQRCVVLLGNDQVIDGYIDRDTVGGSEHQHSIQLVGRGRTQDLVDCSAEWPTHQLIEGDALSIAQNLAEPYGISVQLAEGADVGGKVPALLLNYGETAAEIIQRSARNAGLMAYEDAQGRLMLANVGTKRAASGVAHGDNVQRFEIQHSMDQRLSDIVCSSQAMDTTMELSGDDFFHRETDPNVPRHRLLYIVAEMVATDVQAFTIKMAQWEMSRRFGHSMVVRATVDSWRDSAGRLWTPNTIVPVSLPGNRAGNDLVIGAVTFRRSNEAGTTAEILALPPQAFIPQPIVLTPVNAADTKAVAQ
jgi:prophage tail gpP-like protein